VELQYRWTFAVDPVVRPESILRISRLIWSISHFEQRDEFWGLILCRQKQRPFCCPSSRLTRARINFAMPHDAGLRSGEFPKTGKGFPNETVRRFTCVLRFPDGIDRLQPEHGHRSRPGPRSVPTEPESDGVEFWWWWNANRGPTARRAVLGRASSRSESVQLSRLSDMPSR